MTGKCEWLYGVRGYGLAVDTEGNACLRLQEDSRGPGRVFTRPQLHLATRAAYDEGFEAGRSSVEDSAEDHEDDLRRENQRLRAELEGIRDRLHNFLNAKPLDE